MKKRLFSLLCTGILLLSCFPSASALEGEGRRAVDTLTALGILAADSTDFLYTALSGPALAQPASQLAAAALLVRISGADTSVSAPYRGLSGKEARDASYAVTMGWVDGSAFNPGQAVSANGWFTMVLRFLGYQNSIGDFSVEDAALFVRRTGIVSRAYEGGLNGADLAESAVDLLRAGFKDGRGTVAARLISLGRCAPAALDLLGLSGAGMSVRQAADRHMAAVFCLSLYKEEGADVEEDPDAEATGFFISKEGTAVTCFHSIQEMRTAVATLITGERYSVESVLWYDVDMDLAVLRVSRTSLEGKTASMFSWLGLAGAAEARPGDIVYAISNPLGLGLAINDGILSAVGRTVERYSLPCVLTNADISYGSSGGVLLNIFGHVVAVTSGAYTMGNGMFIAVPTDAVLNVLKDVDAGMAGKPLSVVAEEAPAEKKKPSSDKPESGEDAEEPPLDENRR